MANLSEVEIKGLVISCLEDVMYLVGRQSKRLGLDSTMIYEAIKDELRVEFENNILITLLKANE